MRKLELSKNLPGDKLFKLRKSEFSSIVTFKEMLDISLLINLFVPLIELKN